MDKKIQQKYGIPSSKNFLLNTIEIFPAKIIGMTARYRDVFLYSQYDPIKMIQEEYRRIVFSSKIIVLLGFGLGYLLNLLINDERIQQIYLIETDLTYLNKAIKAVNFSFNVPKVFHIKDKQFLFQVADQLDLLATENIEVLREKTFIYTEQTITEADVNFVIKEKISEQMTIATFGMIWYDNLLSRFFDLRLLKTCEMPAETIKKNEDNILLIGAGPGLQKQLEAIRSQQEFHLIVCIDTIRSFLIKNRIYPDITISADSQNISAYHFKKKENSLLKKEIFLLDSLSSPLVIKMMGQNMISFFQSMNPMNFGFSNNVYAIKSGFSAANMAIDLLYHLGARKITLAGIDLSFPELEPYTGGNYFSRYWASRINRINTLESKYVNYMRARKYIYVSAISGGSVKTTPIMQTYAKGIENFLKNHTCLKLITLSENGIYIEGIKNTGKIEVNSLKKIISDVVETVVKFDPCKIIFPHYDECDKIPFVQLIEKYHDVFNIFQPAISSLLYKKKKRGHLLSDKDKEEAFKIIVFKWEQAVRSYYKNV